MIKRDAGRSQQDGVVLEKISGSTNTSAGREAILSSLVNAIMALRDTRAGDELAGTGVAVAAGAEITNLALSPKDFD